jgi:hypothetical protein
MSHRFLNPFFDKFLLKDPLFLWESTRLVKGMRQFSFQFETDLIEPDPGIPGLIAPAFQATGFP